MTYREKMRENNENLSWCKPISLAEGRVVVIINEKEICGVLIDGKKLEPTPANIQEAARIVKPGYDSYDGWDDASLLLEELDSLELPCHECPWFEDCDAMSDEICE